MELVVLRFGASLAIASSRLFTYHSGVILADREACLIDPGLLPGEIDSLARHITSRGATLTSIILTHGHWDHILGPERLSNVRTVAHAAFPEEGSDQRAKRVANQVTKWCAKQGIDRARRFAVPHPDETFDPVHECTVGPVSIRLIHAPGHAVDHAVVYLEEDGTLWAADMLSDLEIPYVCDSLIQYELTLERLLALGPNTLIPAHGAMTRDASEIRRRFDADRSYLAALHDHVEQALRDGCGVEETVARCADMEFANPCANRRAHRLNVEHAFCELGGRADASRLGWNRLHS